MAKLWDKGFSIDTLLEEFTVGQDYLLDLRLAASDCVASTAHARMLGSIGLLSSGEVETLSKGLGDILTSIDTGSFTIDVSEEDCHTAIEGLLTRSCGEAGKKIHTGRSRNDQVLTALRLFTKDFILRYAAELSALSSLLLRRAEQWRDIPMPGRTHMQVAMPSSMGLWAAAWAEELIDLSGLLEGVLHFCDASPLGSAASYGVPLPLDREMTARLMGFSRVQNNVLYANNSRGRTELAVLNLLDQVGLTLSKMAQDLILFSLPEFGYVSLPKELTSGSSIMPQKRNPDGLELLRAKSATISSCASGVASIVRSLPSGYNRDFQETKEPFFRATSLSVLCVRIMALSIEKLVVYPGKLREACTPELFATDAAIERVRAGESFRDAYRYVGTHLDELADYDPAAAQAARTAAGTAGNLNLDAARTRLAALDSVFDRIRTAHNAAVESLMKRPVDLYR